VAVLHLPLLVAGIFTPGHSQRAELLMARHASSAASQLLCHFVTCHMLSLQAPPSWQVPEPLRDN
jgi:hypothetical protein